MRAVSTVGGVGGIYVTGDHDAPCAARRDSVAGVRPLDSSGPDAASCTRVRGDGGHGCAGSVGCRGGVGPRFNRGISPHPFRRRKPLTASRTPVATHRSLICPPRHRFTVRVTWRVRLSRLSAAVVVASDRCRRVERGSVRTVSVSSSPSRTLPAALGYSSPRRLARVVTCNSWFLGNTGWGCGKLSKLLQKYVVTVV